MKLLLVIAINLTLGSTLIAIGYYGGYWTGRISVHREQALQTEASQKH